MRRDLSELWLYSTKALYKNAQVMGYMDHSREFGIEIDGYRLDMEQVQARKNKIVKTLTGGVEYLLKSIRWPLRGLR